MVGALKNGIFVWQQCFLNLNARVFPNFFEHTVSARVVWQILVYNPCGSIRHKNLSSYYVLNDVLFNYSLGSTL